MKKLRPLFSLLLTAAILFLAVSPARAASGEDPVPTSWDCVMLFAKKDLKGGYRAFLPGEYPDVGVRSASIYLPSDCTVTAFSGKKVGDIYEGQRSFDLVLKMDEDYTQKLDDIGKALIDTQDGGKVPLESVAEIVSAGGPNTISRENVRRKLVVSANVSGRCLE